MRFIIILYILLNNIFATAQSDFNLKILIKYKSKNSLFLKSKELKKIDTLVEIMKTNSKTVIRFGVVNVDKIRIEKTIKTDEKRTIELGQYIVAKGISSDRIVPISYNQYYDKVITKEQAENANKLKKKGINYFYKNKILVVMSIN